MTPLDHDPDQGCGRCPFYGDEFDVCQADRSEHPDGRSTGSDARTSPDSPSPPAPEWCRLRTGPVLVKRPGCDACGGTGEESPGGFLCWKCNGAGATHGPLYESRQMSKREFAREVAASDMKWQEIRYPGDEGTFDLGRSKPLILVGADGSETEAEPIGDDRYRLPDGRVLVLRSKAPGHLAVWEEQPDR